jgi:hypothetical protein
MLDRNNNDVNTEQEKEELDLVLKWLVKVMPAFGAEPNPDYDPEGAQRMHQEHPEIFNRITDLCDTIYNGPKAFVSEPTLLS